MMRIQPWWKKMLSYLTALTLERRESPISGELELVYQRGRYALCTRHAVYSYQDLYMNFRLSFAQMPLDVLPIKQVLVLGMGLGSVPYLLEKQFGRQYHYTLVEIDEIIIEWAKNYGCLSGVCHSPMDVFRDDAVQWVSKNRQQKYDLIIVDIFIDDEIPAAVESIAFLQQLAVLLSPQGILMYNRLTYNEKIMQKTLAFFEKSFKFVFNDAVFLELNGNRILFNRPLKFV